MAKYIVSARNKKSTVEQEQWAHQKDFEKSFTREIGWRWGSFYVTMSKEEMENTPKEDEKAEFFPNFYDGELIETTDGCWEDFKFPEGVFTEEEQQTIQEAWEQENYEGLESLGYSQVDGDTILIGPLDFELVEGSEDEDSEDSNDSDTSGFTTLAETLKK